MPESELLDDDHGFASTREMISRRRSDCAGPQNHMPEMSSFHKASFSRV